MAGKSSETDLFLRGKSFLDPVSLGISIHTQVMEQSDRISVLRGLV